MADFQSYGQQQLLQAGARALLIALFAVLLILWLVGVVTSTTVGGFIHVLLLLALLSLILEMVTGGKHVLAILKWRERTWTKTESKARSTTSKAA